MKQEPARTTGKTRYTTIPPKTFFSYWVNWVKINQTYVFFRKSGIQGAKFFPILLSCGESGHISYISDPYRRNTNHTSDIPRFFPLLLHSSFANIRSFSYISVIYENFPARFFPIQQLYTP